MISDSEGSLVVVGVVLAAGAEAAVVDQEAA
jgi:hypothetical protein